MIWKKKRSNCISEEIRRYLEAERPGRANWMPSSIISRAPPEQAAQAQEQKPELAAKRNVLMARGVHESRGSILV